MRYPLVIFDFDGTLADSFPWFVETLNSVAPRYRFRRISERDMDMLRTMSARQIIRHLELSTWKVPFVVRAMRKRAARDAGGIALFPGVTQMLASLSQAGVAMAIVSSNTEATVRRVLGPEAALFRVFDCGAGVFGKRRHLRRVIERTGVDRARALYVGDELRDLEAAHAEGIRFGGVAWGYTQPSALEAKGADEMFTTVADLAVRLTAG